MDYSECCDELAKMIKEDKFWDAGGAIQFFCNHIENGESPYMSLTLVKQDFDLIDKPDS